MVSFAEFYNLIAKSEAVELHVIEGKTQFDANDFNLDSDDLHYPWYNYEVITFYCYFDEDIKDTRIHVLIAYRGEDDNVKKE